MLLPPTEPMSNIVDNALIAPRNAGTIENTTQAIKTQLNAVLTQLEASDYERELAIAIVSAESNFKNTTGITGDVGVFQFSPETWKDVCEGNPFNIKDNATCALREIRNNQLWRWEASREDRKNYQGWLSRLATSTKEIVLRNDELCSCLQYARRFIPNLPMISNPSKINPNSMPRIGVAILLKYNIPAGLGGYHIGIVDKITPEGYFVRDSNFKRCIATYRFISKESPTIRGFYK